MTTPKQAQCVQKLIAILAQDRVDSYLSGQLAQCFRDGFQGFNSMSLAALQDCARTSGIATQHPELLAQLEALIAAEEQLDHVKISNVQVVGFIDMKDIVGDYDVPENVPEWSWVEQEASLLHIDNGKDGIWEFGINLSRELSTIPKSLTKVIAAAREKNLSYLVFQQN